MKHTPGPWVINKTAYGSGKVGIGQVDNKTDVAEACWVNGNHEQTRVNAKLIAAAPELLEAVERALEETYDRVDPTSGIPTMLRKALAKARGVGD